MYALSVSISCRENDLFDDSFTDINECIEITPAVCSHNCTNTIGSYNCSCRIGYQLNATDSSSCDGKCHNNCVLNYVHMKV